jgi:2-polyprenyl-3-methyl-5-hydroxy-6-metoxy-1,4-benzoquinol methylase
MGQSIEILSIDLLDQQRPLVSRLKTLASSLQLEFGWHYLLDLTWIIARLGPLAGGPLTGKHILDAGAGTGILQWYLADQGAQVLSVDRLSRANLPLRFRTRFHVNGLRQEDLASSPKAIAHNLSRSGNLASRVASQAQDLLSSVNPPQASGRVLIYNQDLKRLADLGDNSQDAVVAVSALEHNPPEELPEVVRELMRVLKPGGMLLATLGTASEKDWYHEPSSGWCYTEATLRRLFGLPPDTPSNYAQYDVLMEALRNCAELRDTLAEFYFQSANNGMPWGKWDPKYQPVGVCKIKGDKG